MAVLSYSTWRSRFHSDPQIIGTKVLLDRKPYIVIGVMPRGFESPLIPGQLNRSALWVPMSFKPDELSPERASNWSYQMIWRQARRDWMRIGLTGPAAASGCCARCCSG